MLQRSKQAKAAAATIRVPIFHLATPTVEPIMLNTQQFIAAQQAQVESFFDLTHKTFSNMEKVVGLNLVTARDTISESADLAKAALAAKDPQSLVALQASVLQPSAEKATAYGRQLADIAKSAQADMVAVAEAQVAAVQQSLHQLVDVATKNAPAGTESGVAFVKQAMEAANSAYANVQKAAKQATDIAEANFNAVTETAVKAAKAAGKSPKKAA
jgi:phasin family protein